VQTDGTYVEPVKEEDRNIPPHFVHKPWKTILETARPYILIVVLRHCDDYFTVYTYL